MSRQTTSQFQSRKFQQNNICRFGSSQTYDQYHPTIKNYPKTSPLFSTKPTLEQKANQAEENKSSQVINLEDLWDSIQPQSKEEQQGKIRISIMEIHEEVCEITTEEFDKMFQDNSLEELQAQAEKTQEASDKAEDLGDLWDQLDQQCSIQNQNISALIKAETQYITDKAEDAENVLQTATNAVQIKAKEEQFNITQLLDSSNDKSTNYNLCKDYLIYDYQAFAMNCFQTNIHSYFGFRQDNDKGKYYLYDLINKESILECEMDSYDQSFLKTSNKKIKIDYQIQYCLKFKIPKTNRVVATAFHKFINNGILYNIKPFNNYENSYEDSLALVEITDGFIGNNCYCNTNVFISQKYTNQPGQLKMIIGMKNGYLIANMGVSGVKSAPYNCRLENPQSNFVFLLGMVDKQSQQFVIRVGEGMSPLIAFAISVGRKRYIDSFSQ